MAKARNLAALAGLAGLAYAMRNKGDSSKTDTGDETERLKARKPAEEEKRRQVTDYMKKAPEAEAAKVAPAPKTTTKAAPTTKTSTTSKDPREAEAGMTRGRPAVVNKNPNGSIEAPAASNRTDAMRNASRANVAEAKRTTSSAGAGRGFVNSPVPAPKNPREAEAGMSRGTRTTSMAGAGRGSVNPPVPKPADPRSAEAGVSRGTRNVSPGPGQADIDKIRRIQETFRVPSSMAGRPGYDEAGNRMKHGGAVKMASGGMTASRRADGIATKGKTRGKIC
jgi:hypothetical protein